MTQLMIMWWIIFISLLFLLVLLDVFDTIFQVSQSFRRIIPEVEQQHDYSGDWPLKWIYSELNYLQQQHSPA